LMNIVSDTGPIIGLAKIGKIYLLNEIAEEILIPPMVHKELLGKIGPESNEIDQALNSFIQIADIPIIEPAIQKVVTDLDAGEKQTIAIAYNLNDDILLVMDDRAGREVASKLRIATTGLVGLLLRSKEMGLIKNVASYLELLRENGYWLSDELIVAAKRLAGESK